MRARDVGLDVITDHPGHACVGVELVERSLEVGRRRLAEDSRVDVRRVLETGDERTGVERRPVLRLPPAVLVQAVQLGAAFELVERAREVHVAEDEVRLRRLVRAADQDRLGVLADELDPVELADDRVHRHGEHASPGELGRRSAWRGLQLLVLKRDPHAAQLLGERRTGLRSAVGHEADPVAGLPQPLHRFGPARDRLP